MCSCWALTKPTTEVRRRNEMASTDIFGLTEKENKSVKYSLLNRLHVQGKLTPEQTHKIETDNSGWKWATKQEYNLWTSSLKAAKAEQETGLYFQTEAEFDEALQNCHPGLL